MLMAEGLVSGGWDAVSNIVAGIGKGASTLVSGFFPTQQRTTIKSETVQAAGGTGQTYRPTAPDAPSINETWLMAEKEWIGSPYEAELSPITKVAESRTLAKTIGTEPDPIGQGLDWALQQTKKVTTLWDQVKTIYGEAREVISGKPTAGYPEGRNEKHINDAVEKGVGIIQQGVAWAEGLLGQVKGLFNIGFPQQGGQPAFSIKHEVQPSTKTTIGIGVAIAAIVVIFLLSRKK